MADNVVALFIGESEKVLVGPWQGSVRSQLFVHAVVDVCRCNAWMILGPSIACSKVLMVEEVEETREDGEAADEGTKPGQSTLKCRFALVTRCVR